jgi:hypothetical protein
MITRQRFEPVVQLTVFTAIAVVFVVIFSFSNRSQDRVVCIGPSVWAASCRSSNPGKGKVLFFFLKNVQIGQPPIYWVKGYVPPPHPTPPHAVKLTTDFNLLPRLRMSGSVRLLPICAFMVWRGTTIVYFYFLLYWFHITSYAVIVGCFNVCVIQETALIAGASWFSSAGSLFESRSANRSSYLLRSSWFSSVISGKWVGQHLKLATPVSFHTRSCSSVFRALLIYIVLTCWQLLRRKCNKINVKPDFSLSSRSM